MYLTSELTAQPPDMSFEKQACTFDEESNGLLCLVRQEHSKEFEFVGRDHGSYEPVRAYSFVGQGSGAYEMSEVKVYHNFRPRPCTWALIWVAVVAVLVCAGCAVYFRPDRSPILKTSVLKTSLCNESDCNCGLSGDWASEKVKFCCEQKGTGCPDDNSVKPMEGIGRLVSVIDGCSTQCLLEGIAADCSDRVRYSSQHQFADDPDKCQASHNLVLVQCPFCATCELADTRCGRAEDAAAKLQPQPQPQPQPQSSGVPSALTPEEQVEALLRADSETG